MDGKRMTPAEWRAMIADATPVEAAERLADVRASGRELPFPGSGLGWLSPEQVEALPSPEMRAWYRERPGVLRDRGDLEFFPAPVRTVVERLLDRLDGAYAEAREAS
ncbi:hypothetical protein [Kineosporia sp. NBRC 101731]|uniref:hypothetical protein n=1 Tax=Kineosporia sp. NBRC 101731 TaxID=3032199 RepID=UPI0024A3D639|nr:hypothetical protein [Kineosporia sp. NBRC 101731]GLY32064.1 hypothetical protein Kisp02_54290 [Kineosporia sp. NBRC 101731]